MHYLIGIFQENDMSDWFTEKSINKNCRNTSDFVNKKDDVPIITAYW